MLLADDWALPADEAESSLSEPRGSSPSRLNRPLPVGEQHVPQVRKTEIRTGDNSVVKVEVSVATNIHIARDAILPAHPATGDQPMISTGGDAEVKSEIDASQNVSAAGDIVQHKVVRSTH